MNISKKEAAAIAKAISQAVIDVLDTYNIPIKHGEQMEIPEFLKKETVAEAGSKSYIVTNIASMKYTVIGADNIHHAEMKATKLFGQSWHQVTNNEHEATSRLINIGYRFLPVKKFNQLIALLQSP